MMIYKIHFSDNNIKIYEGENLEKILSFIQREGKYKINDIMIIENILSE